MAVDLAVLGVPSSAGAHHAGQDLAPGALRERGLIDRLRADGLQVVDVGDVAGERWTVDAIDSTARNLTAVVGVALAVADAVERECRAGRVSLVLGGDCTITLGVVAGLQRVADDVRLAYFDGDADLNSPDRTRSGVLDATGVAHLLGIATTPLAQIGRQTPMLRDDQLILLGYDPTDADSYEPKALTARPALRHASDAELRADPIGVAQAAVESLTRDDAIVAVHFDVDAVDSRDLPLANFPHYGTGIPLGAAGQVLETLIAAPGLAAVVLTEVNPTHDPTGTQLDRYIETVTTAIAQGLGAARPGPPAKP
jgi:arginase